METTTPLTRTAAAILGMLTLEPMTGYDMKKFCEQSLAHFWHESYGNLYPRLKRLEAEQLIESRRERRDRGPDAVVYSLTEAGRQRFIEWLGEDPEPERVRSEFLLKFFFGSHADLDRCAQLVRDHRAEQESKLAAYAGIEAMIRGALGERTEAPFWLMSLRRGQLLTEARLRWCDECEDRLGRMRSEEARTKGANG